MAFVLLGVHFFSVYSTPQCWFRFLSPHIEIDKMELTK